MSDPPKLTTLGVDGRPFTSIHIDETRPDHWQFAHGKRISVVTGETAVTDESDEPLRADGGKNLWTSRSIDDLNDTFKTKVMGLRFVKGKQPELVGHFPHWPDQDPPYPQKNADGTPNLPRTLSPVIPISALDASVPLKMPTDCGRCAARVMGAQLEKLTIVTRLGRVFPFQNGSALETVAWVLAQLLLPLDAPDLVDQSDNNSGNRTIYTKAIDTYRSMTFDQRMKFGEIHGLNELANPNVGQAFIIANLNQGSINDKAPKNQNSFNHHFGAVVLRRRKGRVQITLENAANSFNTETSWRFMIYGNIGLPKNEVRGLGAETFHGVHKNDASFRVDTDKPNSSPPVTMVACPP